MDLIYIGKSKNIRSRILQHSTDNNNGRLQIEDKGTYFENNYNTCIPSGAAEYYSYILEEDEVKRGMAESFLLYLFKTKFNNCDKIKALEKYKDENTPKV